MTAFSDRLEQGMDQRFQIACQYYQAGEFKRAEALCSNILQNRPDDANVLNLMGLIAHRCGRNGKAAELLKKAIVHDPENPSLYCNLGAVFHGDGKFEEAIKTCQDAIRINSGYADAWNNLGLVFQDQQKADEAVSCYQRAIQIQPDYSAAHYNLGNSLQSGGQIAEAIQCYKRAIQIDANFLKAINNLGTALHEMGKFDEAVLCFKKVLQLNPNDAEAHFNAGNSMHGRQRFEEAIDEYKMAIALKPNYPEAFNNLGIVFKDCGFLKKAIACYRKAVELEPNFSKAHSDLLLAMHYDPTASSKDLFSEAINWWKRHGTAAENRFHHKGTVLKERIRVGYVSPDFRTHSVSYFFLPLLMHHNRKEFEVFCYGEIRHPDEVTVRIQSLSDHWRSTAGVGDDVVAQRIYDDGIDILVDLAGHTASNRLPVFARKPAPIQISWLGYPGTTGMAVMDYRLTDDIADPKGDSEKYYSEKLLRPANGFLCYMPPENAPDIGKWPVWEREQITFGSFNNLVKLNEKVVAVWSEILLQIPRSSLLLKSRQLADESVRNRYVEYFKKCGISPDRILMLPASPAVSEHLALYNRVDIALDPFPYNGATTTCEALWMGTPVVTLAGDRHSSRVGKSILTRIGLTDLIADCEKDYVAKAVSLAGNVEGLKEFRHAIRPLMTVSSLCDGKSFARDVEKIYKAIVR